VALTGASLLDRERELAQVGELIEATADGEFRFAVVEGPAGAGKTALLNVLAADAADADIRVLRATGLELEREYPFGVVRQLFEPALHRLDPMERAEVFSGVAALAEELLSGRDPSSGPKPADAGFALAHSFYWTVVGLSDLGPLVLVVDDVQWADAMSLRVLAFLLKRAEELPLLLALARRVTADGEESDALSAVLTGPASVIRPTPLGSYAIGVLLGEALKHELEDDVVAEAERLTEGNPLFVRELADALSATAVTAADDPMNALHGAAPAAVGRRAQRALARLDSDAQAIAKAAAMLGEEVPLQRAAAMAELGSERAGPAADALARAGILAVGEPLRFRHPLVREAVLESIEPRARALAHAHSARLLIAAGEPPELAAVHLLQSDPAGDPDVVGILRAAAVRAIDAAAPELAIDALRRALREPPERTVRPLVLKELAIIEAQVGDPAAIEHYEEAFSSADSLEQIADGAGNYAALLCNRGRFDEAGALIDRVVGAVGDRERRLMLEAEAYAWSFYVPAARERLARVTEGLTGASPTERLLLALRACNELRAGRMKAADTAPLVGAALGDGLLRSQFGAGSVIYLMMLSELLTMQEYDWADRELEVAVAEARRDAAWFGLATASTFRSIVANVRGQLLKAEADARTGLEIATQMGWLAGAPFPLTQLITVLNATGGFREAERLLDEYNFSGPLPEGAFFDVLLGVRGRLRLLAGRPELAIEDLEELRARLSRAEDADSTAWADLAAGLVPALVQVGRADEARDVAEEAVRRAHMSGIPRSIADGLRACALAQADGPDIDQLWEVAAIYERIGFPVILARTLVDIGAALRRQRQPAAAREPLRRALDLARECGARALAERAEHELRAAGARPRRDRVTGRDALTGTEMRVAQLAIEGMTNRQIAETLFVTKKTVESHLAHVFQKLGIHARNELQQALDATGELS
jgi:DNA-binding NarL/FixJ family response regulator